MIELEYHGPHDAVDVVNAETGDLVGTVGHGCLIPVPDNVAESLLAQGPAHWRKPKKPDAVSKAKTEADK